MSGKYSTCLCSCLNKGFGNIKHHNAAYIIGNRHVSFNHVKVLYIVFSRTRTEFHRQLITPEIKPTLSGNIMQTYNYTYMNTQIKRKLTKSIAWLHLLFINYTNPHMYISHKNSLLDARSHTYIWPPRGQLWRVSDECICAMADLDFILIPNARSSSITPHSHKLDFISNYTIEVTSAHNATKTSLGHNSFYNYCGSTHTLEHLFTYRYMYINTDSGRYGIEYVLYVCSPTQV